MKGNGEAIVWALAFEVAPAAILGSASMLASAITLALPRLDVIPLSAGFGAFAVSWLLLRRLGRGTGSLPLANFDQSDLERELAILAEEMQRGDGHAELEELILEDEVPADLDCELVLDDPLAAVEEDSRVVRLFDPANETAGQMQARIDRHLRSTARPPLSDATQELHDALSALRQSLR
jgi:hypothetical protein